MEHMAVLARGHSWRQRPARRSSPVTMRCPPRARPDPRRLPAQRS